MILCDLDNTLTKLKRSPYEDGYPLIPYDQPSQLVPLLIGKDVVFMTGRSESARELTTTWLKSQGFLTPVIYMRKANDYRSAHLVKAEMLEQLPVKPSLVIDDDERVIKMFQQRGITTLKVTL